MLALSNCRVILIRAQNLLYLSEWEYGKRQLYGSAMESVQEPRPQLLAAAGLKSSTSTKTE